MKRRVDSGVRTPLGVWWHTATDPRDSGTGGGGPSRRRRRRRLRAWNQSEFLTLRFGRDQREIPSKITD